MMQKRDMRGIVLCAGRGGRLSPFTDLTPKCLLSFGGKTILERCLEGLRSAGIGEILLVTGYHRELIERFVRDRGIEGIVFVVNEAYARTNTAVSLNLALKRVSSDVVVVNGDVLFHPSILAELVALPVSHGAAVDADISMDGEEVKVIVRGGRIVRIGKDLNPKDSLGEAIGLYKIGRDSIADLIRIYDGLEAKGEREHFFEKGFDILNGKDAGEDRSFGVFLTRGRPWVEIDTPEDYRHAERDIAPRL
ncbi:MAG: phosphocholine cytidylyltransferase family protein [Acidobacteriota bacterium]|jgi:Predicted sugar nucleotidyltransferases|nr:phosphocholine cytidylyltransferase family protein [Acidobacteriota bacterium]OQB58179.1 MAG: Bifunctional IPC transferase and DIPP synthase [Candidatus Aminicenantes bacterium ADurb.Bin147]HNQ80529.1 phosphocholine cytidylyltransferase family protein [Candidatus Aminicenantes bacterium]MDD8010589.1 phosphocholine cytidylyltransferase family protein [Acidobacteriota bacterium]MDD8029014.1 phosphocholine cytidylyltransferase family protein [Acidobacteriota bacterium]